MENLITDKELCEWLKIHRATAYNWRKEGMPFIGSRGSIRYSKDEVTQWLKERAKNKKTT